MNDETRTPYYYRVAETIRKRIKSRHYQPYGLIPSEKDLEKEFAVSNITIRKALELLVQDNLLVRKRGIGTQVIPEKDDRLAIKLTGNFKDWYKSASGTYPKLQVEVIDIAIELCPEPIREIFSLEENSKIWKMTRIRKFKGEPISYYINYGRPEIFKKCTKKKLFQQHSFVHVLRNYCDIEILRIEQNVEAITADMDIASILDVQFGAPLFFGKNIYYGELDTPVEITYLYYRGDRYIYNAVIQFDQKNDS
jgi:GntR family transcriptional regulator